jgi:hypothetical protein
VDHSDPQQSLDVHVVRLRLQRIPEENHEVDAAVDDPRADLLIPTERPAQEASNRQAELRRKQCSRRACCKQFVMDKRAAIVPGPVQQVALTVVMRDQRHTLSRRHWYGDPNHCVPRDS